MHRFASAWCHLTKTQDWYHLTKTQDQKIIHLQFFSENIPSTVYVCRQTLPSAMLTQIELGAPAVY